MIPKSINSFIVAAFKESARSNMRHQVGAIIFKGGRILSRGHNQMSKHLNKIHPNFQRWAGSVHAEVDAIIKARRDLKGTYIVVVRSNAKGEMRIAKPCNECMKYIRHVGIKKVYYTDNDGVKMFDV